MNRMKHEHLRLIRRLFFFIDNCGFTDIGRDKLDAPSMAKLDNNNIVFLKELEASEKSRPCGNASKDINVSQDKEPKFGSALRESETRKTKVSIGYTIHNIDLEIILGVWRVFLSAMRNRYV